MMFRSISTLAVVSLCALALALCCSAGETAGANTAKPIVTGDSEPSIYIPDESQLAVDWAIADLAEQLGIAHEQIKVSKISRVEWSNSSLGCPSAGQMYAQVITPGFVILLESGDHTWEYHSASGATTAKFCGAATNSSSPLVTRTAI